MNTSTLRSVSQKKGIQISAIVIALFLACTCSLSKAQNVGINTTGAMPDKSAALDINVAPNYNQGLLIPRMSMTQRNNLAASCSCTPAQSLLIFNTTDSCFETYLGTTWHSIWCTNSPCVAPIAATAGTNTPSSTQIVWSWNASAGAATYYYNTVNNFSTATSNGASTTYTQTSLSCNTTYTLYVWADNSCGNSAAVTLTQTTSACGATCGSQTWTASNLVLTPVATYTVSQASYSPQPTGMEWCYNDVAANCTTYGGLFDWNNATGLPNGSGSGAASTCNPCGSGGVQGLCPSGYHIPTDLEWSQYEYCVESTIAPTGSTTLADFQTGTAWRGSTLATAGVYQGPGAKMKETTAQGGDWADGAYSNNLSGFSMLAAGITAEGSSTAQGIYAIYWSSTESGGANAWYRNIFTGISQSYRTNYEEWHGFSLRCLQN